MAHPLLQFSKSKSAVNDVSLYRDVDRVPTSSPPVFDPESASKGETDWTS